MNNINGFETESYQKSDEIPFTWQYRLLNYLNLIRFSFLISCYLCYELLEKIYNVITFKSKKKSIENQVALVTGGANGLGRETAICLAERKCKIAIADLNLPEAQKTAEYISKKYSVETKAFKIDVSDYKAVKLLRSDIESTLGPVDILINNAGILPILSLREGTHHDLQKIIDVNLTSHFWVNN